MCDFMLSKRTWWEMFLERRSDARPLGGAAPLRPTAMDVFEPSL